MKLAITLMLLSTALLAQTEETKGNITVTRTGTAVSTTLHVSSTDSRYKNFVVACVYRSSSDDALMPIQHLTLLTDRAGSVLLPFPEDRIIWYSVTEIQPGTTQAFMLAASLLPLH